MGFQTDKGNDQAHNAAVFDYCRLKNIHVTLNTNPYPTVDFNANFTQGGTSRRYMEAAGLH